MTRQSPRALRLARIRLRLALRRLDRGTPEWLRWLTPWGSSLVLHGLALLLFGVAFYVSNDRAPDPLAFQSEFPKQLVEDVTALVPSDHSGDPFAETQTDEPPSLTLDPRAIDPNVINLPQLPPSFKIGRDLQTTPPDSSDQSPHFVAEGTSVPGLKVALTVPFAGRQGLAKAKLVRREGGSVESEKAVERGLDWLLRHQKSDGSWGLDHKPECRKGRGCPPGPHVDSDTAATGLALLPMLGAGQAPDHPSRYQKAVTAGLAWLIKIQKPDGDLFTGGAGNAHMYSHAIATMALSEAYGITGAERYREPATKAVRFIERAQSKADGGWRYNPGQPGDTSVLGWQMFALRSAHLAGIKVSDAAIRGCIAYLDKAAADPVKTSYAYQPGGPATPVMTAEALLIRQYLGWGPEIPAMAKGSASVFAQLKKDPQRNIYYWYYATQLLHNLQGPHWQQWNPAVRDGLIAFQVKGNGCDRGSWDPLHPKPDHWGAQAGRHFTTALSLLTLEVYYRYLPLYRTTREQDSTLNREGRTAPN